MRESIAYIGHSYHNKTKSTSFLIDYLKEFFDVDVFWDDWGNGNKFDYELLNQKDYKAIVFFQSLPEKEDFGTIKCKNVIYFPMHDHIKLWNFNTWYAYKDCKMINFCKNTHEKLKKWGFNSIYLQYFPEPEEFCPGNKNEVFFWQRANQVNIKNVKKIFRKNKNYKIHIHKITDPSSEFIAPSDKDENRFKITYSSWFDTKEEMFDLMRQKQIYIAPRIEEGIGLSFLEAMAMGKAVIANNALAMNEYIKDGVNGYLFNYKIPKPINFSNIEQVQKNAFEFCKEGHKKWLHDRIKIIDVINSPYEQFELSEFRKKIYFFTSMQKKDIIQFKLGKRGYLFLLGLWILKKT